MKGGYYALSSLWSSSSSVKSSSVCPAATYRLSFLMICKNPYISTNGQAFGCGQCLPCRLNRKRVWTHRIMLENICHSDAAFVTLTYDSNNLPLLDPIVHPDFTATLVPKHLQDFLKRLRKSFEPMKLRFYAVGEYGDQTHRPHYHVALFGYPSCRNGRTRRNYRTGAPEPDKCCTYCKNIFDTWRHGIIDVGSVTAESASYLAGYVTKKMTAKDDSRLYGRHPEFARMSLRPGIGYNAMHDVASTLMSFNLEELQTDVPSSLRHGTRLLPLGRYLRRALRTMVGLDAKMSQQAFDELQEKLRPLYLSAVDASISSKGSISIKEALVQQNKGQIDRIESRSRIFKKRSQL